MPDLDPVERAFAFSQALEQNPALATPEGRADYEVRRTLFAYTSGVRPVETVLGAVMATHYLYEANEPKSISHICATACLDGENYLGVFTVEQILEDLVTVGILEATGPKRGSVDELLVESGTRKYCVKPPLPLQIERLDPEADAVKDTEIRTKEAAYLNMPRVGIIRHYLNQRRGNKWIKQMQKEIAAEKG